MTTLSTLQSAVHRINNAKPTPLYSESRAHDSQVKDKNYKAHYAQQQFAKQEIRFIVHLPKSRIS